MRVLNNLHPCLKTLIPVYGYRRLQTRFIILILSVLLACTKPEPRCQVWEVTDECQPKTLWGCGYYNSDGQTFWTRVCDDARDRVSVGAFDTVTNNDEKIVIRHYLRRVE